MRVIAGPEKKARLLSEKEQRITAYHEMGHALVGHFLENTDPVHKITVVSRGQALGLHDLAADRGPLPHDAQARCCEQIAMTMGGRAAEEIVFDEVTTGAANDIEKVTATAKQMVMRFGMSEKLGPRVLGRDTSMPFLGRDLRRTSPTTRRRSPARSTTRSAASSRRRHDIAHARAARAHRRPAPDLADPDRARDDRQGPVRAPARRRAGGGRLPGSGARRGRAEPKEPERRPAPAKPRPFPLPGGAAMQPPEPGSLASRARPSTPPNGRVLESDP